MRNTFACGILFLASLTLSAVCDEPKDTTEKLEAARDRYLDEQRKISEAVELVFEAREKAARKKGDKEEVDQINEDRGLFQREGKLPKFAPERLISRVDTSRRIMEGAYVSAIKEFTRDGKDKLATQTEEELKVFFRQSPISAFLFDLKPTKIEVNSGRFVCESVSVGGKDFERSLLLHPFASFTRGKYLRYPTTVHFQLDRQWAVFLAGVAVAKPEIADGKMGSEVTFELIGDGKVLWESKKHSQFEQTEPVKVDVSKVEVLALRVTSQGHSGNCRGYWLNPALLKFRPK